ELVAHEPEVVDGLEVVARGGLAVPGCPAGEEVVARPTELRRRRRESGSEVQRERERYKACAAASGTSKSGTSSDSYRHAPRTVPSASTRNAVRSATSSIPRQACPTPKPRIASAFQSE